LDVREEFGLQNDTARLWDCDPEIPDNQRWSISKDGEIVSGLHKQCLTAIGTELGANVERAEVVLFCQLSGVPTTLACSVGL
jgi:hypothetical protein